MIVQRRRRPPDVSHSLIQSPSFGFLQWLRRPHPPPPPLPPAPQLRQEAAAASFPPHIAAKVNEFIPLATPVRQRQGRVFCVCRHSVCVTSACGQDFLLHPLTRQPPLFSVALCPSL